MKNPFNFASTSDHKTKSRKKIDFFADFDPKPKKSLAHHGAKISKSRLLFYILTGLLAALLISGFLLVYYLIAVPKKVRSFIAQAQPLYEEYRKDMRSVVEHLESEDVVEDSDGLEREIEKAKGYIEATENHQNFLQPLIASTNLSQVRSYRKDLETYLDLGTQALTFEKNELKLGEGILKLTKDVEALESEMQTAIVALFFNPGSDASAVRSKYETALSEFKNIEIAPEYQEAKDLVIRQHELQLELLKKIQEASSNRNSDQLEESFTWLEEQQIELEKDMNRVEDQYRVRVRDLKHDIDDLEAEITREYNRLDAQYKF